MAAAPKKAPAFQFYAAAWLASGSVTRMSAAEEGTYIRLLAHQWQLHIAGEGELLPEEPAELRLLTKLDAKAWRLAWSRLERHFPVFEGGGRANPTLLGVWGERDAFVQSRRANGANGGRPKKEPPGNHVVSDRIPDTEPTPNRGESSGVCSLTTVPPSPADAGSPPGPSADLDALFADQEAMLRAAALPHEGWALDVLLAPMGANRAAVIGALHAIASGMHPIRSKTTGRSAEAPDVMRAVAEMAANGDRWNARLLGGYVRRLVDAPPEPPTTEEREAKRLALQLRAQAAILEPTIVDTEEAKAERAKAREEAMAAYRALYRRNRPEDEAAA